MFIRLLTKEQYKWVPIYASLFANGTNNKIIEI